MNVRVMMFSIFFVLFVNIINGIITVGINQSSSYNTSGLQTPDLDEYQQGTKPWSFLDFLKSFVFPSNIYDSLSTISNSLAVLFMFIYYIPVLYSVVFFIIKMLPFVGTG